MSSECKTPAAPDINSCPKAPVVPPATPNDVARVCHAMGMVPCSKASGKVKILFASASVHASVGCEQQNVLVKKYRSIQQQMSCMMSQTSTCQSVNVSAENTINIIVGPQGSVDCPLSIDQNIKVKMVNKGTFSNELKQAMSQHAVDLGKEIIQQVQDSTTKGETNPAGQKNVTSVQNDIQTLSSSTSFQNSITNAMTSVSGKNGVNITINGKWKCGPSGKFEIHQNIVLDAMIDQGFKAALDQISKQASVTKFISEIAQKQKQTATEDSNKMSIFTIIIVVAILGGLGYFLYTHREELKDPVARKKLLIKLGIYILVIVIVLLIIYYILNKIGSKFKQILCPWCKSS
jgi:hypothetical protein